jgi:Asp-tRNA(Asn)/Glu-tRNA(Gln) amidotransferase A subunit family amidase
MAGCPAISIPGAPSKSGLPIGFQLVGNIGRDELLLDIAAQYERTRPWTIQCPI